MNLLTSTRGIRRHWREAQTCELPAPSSCRWVFKNLHLGNYLPSAVVSMWRILIWSLQMAEGRLRNPAARVERRPGLRRHNRVEERYQAAASSVFAADSLPQFHTAASYISFIYSTGDDYFHIIGMMKLHLETSTSENFLFSLERWSNWKLVRCLCCFCIKINPFGLVKQTWFDSVYFETRRRKTNPH